MWVPQRGLGQQTLVGLGAAVGVPADAAQSLGAVTGGTARSWWVVRTPRTRISQAPGEVTTANVEGPRVLKLCASSWLRKEILQVRTKVTGQDACSNTRFLFRAVPRALSAQGRGVVGAQPHADTATQSPRAEFQGRRGNPAWDDRPPGCPASPLLGARGPRVTFAKVQTREPDPPQTLASQLP